MRFNPPQNIPTRPTTDFAKEGLFNVLNNSFNFENIKVLDLFGGHQSERRLAHRFGTQHLLVDGEDLSFDLDLDGRIAGEKEIRRLFSTINLNSGLVFIT